VEAVYCNPDNFDARKEKLARGWPAHRDGYSFVPEGPGLGITVDEDALDEAQARFKPPMQPRLRAYDGSVRDW